MKISTLACTIAIGAMSLSAVGQSDKIQEISRSLQEKYPDIKGSDIQNLNVDAEFISEKSGAHYFYLNQTYDGIRIKNSTITAAFTGDGELFNLTGNLYSSIVAKVDGSTPSVAPDDAVLAVVNSLGIQGSVRIEPVGKKFSVEIDGGDYRHETNAELAFWATPEEEIKLVWVFDIDMPDQEHWYQFLVSAETGQEIERLDWVLNCSPALSESGHVHEDGRCLSHSAKSSDEFDDGLLLGRSARTTLDGSGYNVFPFPAESPNHGDRDILTEPAEPTASPFGWHDTNGMPGAEFTITRGNNVYAYEDAGNTNFPGDSPDGGEELNFDFALNLNAAPESYQEASTTNLFYANNMIHDLLYAYGFDEASGNFQTNNYGNGGQDNDEVRAEAQDGEDFNNANMATPGDGSNPRMQMYLWNGGTAAGSFSIDAPADIAGSYLASPPADFGPAIGPEGFTGMAARAEDAETPLFNACSQLINPEDVEGKIAVLFRGGCSFVEKVLFAQNAGANGVIVVNNIFGEDPAPLVGASDEVEIPSLMVSLAVGNLIFGALDDGEEVIVTLEGSEGSTFLDGSFDNGIVVHEYVHGLTNRLTGGGNNTGCLFNEEQMGEGWSDWYALMFTMNLDFQNPTFRPMGTFASGEPVDGNGIRPVPYDTSFAVNDYTYADLPSENISIPHGVGFVWSTMLWDLTWALMDTYGYDSDLINGTAGNNVALQLVTEALKLQPCGPGFVDGRDAILAADVLLYDGANECLIWEVFAKRGLGVDADQGSTNSRSDGTASFDVPAICQEVFLPPTAAFSASAELSCNGLVEFTDESQDVPQGWLWDFGDGNTSDEQNPIHQYEEEGTYTVSLTVTNTLGEDQAVESNLIQFDTPDVPSTDDVEGCAGETVQLVSSSPDGNDIRWLDSDFDEIGLGDNIEIVIGSEDETYYAQNYSELPFVGNAGPETLDFGSGGNHSTAFVGTVDFEVFEPVFIESALVNSGVIGPRTIFLFSEASGGGDAIDAVNVNVDFTGEDRINLGFVITEPGVYSIGLNFADFYRHETGADYPYNFGGIMSVIGSSAGPEFYYYFYDLEVSTVGCVSDVAELTAAVTGEAAFEFEEADLTVSFTDVSPEATSWLWNFGDGNASTEQNPVHTYATLGNYEVSLTVDDGCSITNNVPVGTTSVNDIGNAAGFSIYPNPTADMVALDNLEYGNDRFTVRLVDISGKEVLKRDFVGEKLLLNVDALSSGVYFLTVSERGTNSILFRDKLSVTD